MTELEVDGHRIALAQPARGAGYRFNVDSLHLARFSAARVRGLVVDLGAGTGVVALVAARLAPRPPREIVLVESDPVAARYARENAASANASTRTIEADVADAAKTLRGRADVVLSNPPYFEPGRGRSRDVSPRARMGRLSHFADATRTLLGRRGRAFFVYPASDFVRFVTTFEERGLVAKRARFVHPSATSPARVALVELCAGKPGGLIVEPMLLG